MKSLPDIILVGGGGHCSSVIDVIENEGRYRIAGIVDVPEKVGHMMLNYPVIGNDSELEDLIAKFSMAHISMGHISSPEKRIQLYNIIIALGATTPVIIAPSAHVSKYATIGEGSIVMHQALVNVHARIGDNCIINNKALIEHNTQIGNHCHVSTGAIVNGSCNIGPSCFIGSGAVIKHGISIAQNSIIGAGAVVYKDINKSGTYVGNPTKQIFRL